jgi:hypothetical protein
MLDIKRREFIAVIGGGSAHKIRDSSPASQYSCKYSLSSRGERPT